MSEKLVLSQYWHVTDMHTHKWTNKQTGILPIAIASA